MKKYYEFTYEVNVTCLIELDNELYCERAIYKTGEQFITTNLSIKNEKYFLPEGSFKDCFEQLKEITQQHFTDIWNSIIEHNLVNWNKLKNELKVGQIINVEIICFYPQGVMLDIGYPFFAISNYNEFEKHLGNENMYPGIKTTVSIEDFDNKNLWIKVKPTKLSFLKKY